VSASRWQQIKRIVDQALDRNPEDRAAFLDEACPDSGIRREVESLLSHEADSFMESPPASDEQEDPKKELSSRETTPKYLMGQTISHYELREKLGKGGMGEVFLAQDQSLGRRVALKVLSVATEEDETAKKRFVREAKSAAALDHPYICKIYEIGEDAGRPFIAMEYIGGETLGSRLQAGAMPTDEAVRIAIEIAEAVDTAHREDIVHRDLKPANIMLTVGGHVKVLDFGLAKRVTNEDRADSQFETASVLTGQGMTLGTLAYMSPEQLRGDAVDARSDIFSFGTLLYEMVAGQHPFSKSTTVDTAAAILNLPPAPLETPGRGIPGLLEEVIEKMLAKEPGSRYRSLGEVRAALDSVSNRASPGTSSSFALPVSHLAKHSRKLVAAATLGLVLAAGISIGPRLFSTSSSRDGPPSVAVLPFTNISDDPLDTDYLAEGMSQAVAAKLTQVGLRVTPWDTARRYRDSNQSADVVARELNVDSVLVGTFHVADDEILTNLTLVDAETGFQSWADIIVEPYEDIFQLQLRIASGVATSLKDALTGAEAELLAVPVSASIDAYDFYLQGAHIMQEGNEEATNVADQYFQRAVALDPDLAEAHVGLGAVHTARYEFGWGGDLGSLEQAESSYQTALVLERDTTASMRARRGLVQVNLYRGQSEACLVQGADAASFGGADDIETLLARGDAYFSGGLPERALPILRRVLDFDPVNDGAQFGLVMGSFWAGEYEKTIEAGNEFTRRFGDNSWVQAKLGHAHFMLENYEQAREHYEVATTAADPHFDALIFDGILLDRVGARSRATKEWQRGVELIEPKLESSPDNLRLRLVFATLLGLLGEREAMERETERLLAMSDFSTYEIYFLAAAHAKLGNVERSVELLELSVDRGLIGPAWRTYLSLASPNLLEMAPFQSFVQLVESEERRLSETY